MAKLVKMVAKDFAKAMIIDDSGYIDAITVSGRRVTAWSVENSPNGIVRRVFLDAVVAKEEARSLIDDIRQIEKPYAFETFEELFSYLRWAETCKDSKGRVWLCFNEKLCEEDGRVRKCSTVDEELEELFDPPE